MRVFVAGRQGQVALSLARALPGAGHEVFALDLPDLDLSKRESIRGAMSQLPWRPDVVVNAAAYTAVDRAEDDRETAFLVNGDGVGWLATEAAQLDAPFVHFSTDYVFDGRAGRPYTEDDETGPLGVYGASKRAGERAALAAQPRTIVLRTAWVCSPDGHNFVRTMLRLAREGRQTVGVVADQFGAPTFAGDLAAAVVSLLPWMVKTPASDPRFGVFHFTGVPHTTWHEFASEIFAGIRARGESAPTLTSITTADYPTRAIRPADGRLDSSRIAAVHGIVAADWRRSLAVCLDELVGPVART
jgi:dTDP-4-dehydrorhamnose reductase